MAAESSISVTVSRGGTNEISFPRHDTNSRRTIDAPAEAKIKNFLWWPTAEHPETGQSHMLVSAAALALHLQRSNRAVAQHQVQANMMSVLATLTPVNERGITSMGKA